MYVLAVALIAAIGSISSPQRTIHLEAEGGTLVGTSVATEAKGYSGTGYASGFDAPGDKVILKTEASGGLYEVRIRYHSPFGEKGYELEVNGAGSSGLFAGTGDTFATHRAGKVELRTGENTVVIEKGWGYYGIDYVELVPTSPSPKPKWPPKTLVDPKATARTRALMSFLVDHYGTSTLSGQYDQPEVEYVRAVTDRMPAILGGDLMDYSPSRIAHGADAKDLTEQWIAQARAGQILTLSWHWNAPKDLLDKDYQNERGETVQAQWWAGFYTYATTFDVQRALDNPNSEDYRLLLRDIDAIAVQLKKLAAADVPVLWRPLHEAEGGWFWWGAKGPDAYTKLWRLLFDRLTKHHGLHNLIWVHTGVDPNWYPGDRYVDIIGVDAYPSDRSDPLIGTWDDLQERFDGRKLLAVTEFGGVPEVAKMHRFGARWSYFVSWSGSGGPQSMDKETLRRIYRDPLVLNADGLRQAQ